jgi:hypothetical protein
MPWQRVHAKARTLDDDLIVVVLIVEEVDAHNGFARGRPHIAVALLLAHLRA